MKTTYSSSIQPSINTKTKMVTLTIEIDNSTTVLVQLSTTEAKKLAENLLNLISK